MYGHVFTYTYAKHKQHIHILYIHIGMEKGWYSAKCGCTTPETGLEFKNRAKAIVEQIWQIHNTPVEERNIAGRSFKNMMFVIHGKCLCYILHTL